MRSVPGRLCSLSLAFIIALPALLPMVGAGSLATSQIVPMPPGDFILYKADHFDIYYDSTRITDVSEAVVDAEAAYSKATAFFGPYDYRVRIILAANHLQYTVILNQDSLPENNIGSGWGDADRGTIVIESPDQLDNFTTVLAHELTHIVMRTKLQITKNSLNMPEWFAEGLAIYVSGELNESSRSMITDAAVDDKYMSVNQTEEILEHSDDGSRTAYEVSMAYAQSGMLVDYIANKFGNDTIKSIMQDFATSGDLDKAFMGRIGYTPYDLNADMKVRLKEQRDQEIRSATAQRVYGYVVDASGMPVGNETITFTSNDSTKVPYLAMTNASGFYQLNLTYGPLKVHLDRQGYQKVDNSITLQKNEVRLYNVTMVKAITPVTQNEPADSGAADNGLKYVILAVANIAAILAIGFVFWRARK